MRKLVLIAMAIGFGAVPALADEFYIVQDTTTKECTVVQERPYSETTVVVSPDGTVYSTSTEAEEALNTIEVCRSVPTDEPPVEVVE